MMHVRGPPDPVHFHTAAEVMAWKPDSVSPLMVATVPLAPRKVHSAVQMLAGFDNGDWTYWTEFDANPQGGPRGNVYNFPYWQYVDAVYYYVHETVAVPPTVWTNAAHRNGVKMYAAVTPSSTPSTPRRSRSSRRARSFKATTSARMAIPDKGTTTWRSMGRPTRASGRSGRCW